MRFVLPVIIFALLASSAYGLSTFDPYSPCYTKRGKLRKKVNKTIAHRDHIHIGMSKPGAKARTSFWTAG